MGGADYGRFRERKFLGIQLGCGLTSRRTTVYGQASLSMSMHISATALHLEPSGAIVVARDRVLPRV